MFAVIYRGYVKPHLEAHYQELWKKVAGYFIAECGALGSTLHRAEDGLWVAYSRWPSKAMRDAAWLEANSTFPLEVREAIEKLKECIDKERELPEIAMEIVEALS